MSQSDAIQNAEAVIERFGGIRPMASKTNVPVTTIQGWKKRNVIPAGRRGDIIKAAQVHNIDLSGVLDTEATANQNTSAKSASKSETFSSVPTAAAAAPSKTAPSMFTQNQTTDDGLKKKLAEAEERAVTKSTLITFFLLAVAIIALAIVLWPSAQNTNAEADRIRQLEENVKQLEGRLQQNQEEQSVLGSLIPQDLDQKIANLQAQALQAQQQVGAALQKAQEISQDISDDVLAENAGNLEKRLAKLEAHVNEIAGSPVMAGLMDRFGALQATPEGESQMAQAASELSAVFANMQGAGSEQINAALESARSQSTAIGQTMEGVPSQDLKAAALLLGMTQFRSSLSRDNAPFEEDLNLLMSLVGTDDPALTESLQKLAPKAKEGVLTPAGLSQEFKAMTGEIVIASLKGEEVSIQEKAQARFNNLLQIEKDGELVTGTPTQATLAKTETLLEAGDVAGALAMMKTLDGPAAQQAQPWMEQARATLMAQQVKDFLTANMNLRAFGQRTIGGITAGSGAYSGATLIQDEATGINILKQNQTPLENLPAFE